MQRGVNRAPAVARAWDDDELDRARKMRRDQKLGATAIACQLGRTRNSVIAKLWRENEPGQLCNASGPPGTGTGTGRFPRAEPRAPTVRQFSWETANG